ncbi:MAG: SHOCT domain-containing protein [Planctomycetes bacterium]|nr:SHOCT domain-containing protein [Planctomycetota bacterium]
MTLTPRESQLRWGIYALLIAIAVGNMAGRLLAVNAVNRVDLEKHLTSRDQKQAEESLKKKLLSGEISEEEFQKLLADKKQRIARTRQMQRPFLSANDRSRWLAVRALVEQGTFQIDGVLDRTRWDTIDMVQHRGRDGKLHLYSSKPPLLVTLLAGETWLLSKVTGMTLETHPYFLGRMILVTVNIFPLILMFVLVAKLAERFGTTDWGRMFVVASATMGTLLVPFSVVLNNHLVAAVSAAVALYCFVRIWCDDEQRLRYYAFAGIAAAFTAANELPALAFLVMIAFALLLCNRRAWFVGFLPAVAMIVVAFFATNYAAHACLTPPYMHRSSVDPEENWYEYTYTIEGKERESYWLNRQGIDRGEPTKAIYALHVLVGHHGVFSLTPIWLLSVVGLSMWMLKGNVQQRQLALGIAMLSMVCLVFYIGFRPQADRNYGGMTSGFRWMFWFAPLWLTAMIPAADWFGQSRNRQAIALALLVFSTFSASYPTWNPWTHPWLYHWLEYCGWQGF